MTLLEMMGKLALAFLVGGLVGLERERRDRPAGLRTHIVVCVGSALITLVSMELASPTGERGRVAAQIVSGIGFLGAGTIFRYGFTVQGLTTAAGVWSVAGIGMAVAVGGTVSYAAVFAAVLVFGTNRWIRPWEERVLQGRQVLLVTVDPGDDAIELVTHALRSRGVVVRQVECPGPDESDDECLLVRVGVRLPPRLDQDELLAELQKEPGIRSARWD